MCGESPSRAVGVEEDSGVNLFEARSGGFKNRAGAQM